MDANDDVGYLMPRGARPTIASKLAPTVAIRNCGSRLAGDGVPTVDASLKGLIAGKPAPTGPR